MELIPHPSLMQRTNQSSQHRFFISSVIMTNKHQLIGSNLNKSKRKHLENQTVELCITYHVNYRNKKKQSIHHVNFESSLKDEFCYMKDLLFANIKSREGNNERKL